MANYFYVKSGLGTRTAATDTGFTGLESGAFGSGNLTAAAVYATIEDAVSTSKANPPVAGDFIIVSDAHAGSYAASANIDFVGTEGSATPLSVISVDDTNADAYSPGASDTITGFIFSYTGTVSIYGVSLGTGGNVLNASAQNADIYLQDLTLTTTDTSTCVRATTDNLHCRLVNVDMIGVSGTKAIETAGGSTCRWYGGSTTTLTKLTGNDFSVGGGTIHVFGCNLSSVTTIVDTLSGTADDQADIKLFNCTLNSSLTYPVLDTTLNGITQRVEMYNSDDTTANKYHELYITDGSGIAKTIDTVYVTDTATWYEGSSKSSIEIQTGTRCGRAQPFVIELPAQYVDLGNTSTDVITVEFVYDANDITLDKESIAAYLCYPDGGASFFPVSWVTSGTTVGAGNYGIDPLASGTALDAANIATGSWTGLGSMTTATAAGLKLDTSTDAGEATAVSVRIEIYEPSIASGDLYIHPILTVSAT